MRKRYFNTWTLCSQVGNHSWCVQQTHLQPVTMNQWLQCRTLLIHYTNFSPARAKHNSSGSRMGWILSQLSRGGGGYTPDRSPIYSRFTFTANLESPINLTKINASGVIIHTKAGRWTRTHDHYLADFSHCKPNIPVDAWFQSPVCYTLQ